MLNTGVHTSWHSQSLMDQWDRRITWTELSLGRFPPTQSESCNQQWMMQQFMVVIDSKSGRLISTGQATNNNMHDLCAPDGQA